MCPPASTRRVSSACGWPFTVARHGTGGAAASSSPTNCCCCAAAAAPVAAASDDRRLRAAGGGGSCSSGASHSGASGPSWLSDRSRDVTPPHGGCSSAAARSCGARGRRWRGAGAVGGVAALQRAWFRFPGPRPATRRFKGWALQNSKVPGAGDGFGACAPGAPRRRRRRCAARAPSAEACCREPGPGPAPAAGGAVGSIERQKQAALEPAVGVLCNV
jgi:hypothetical protein